MTDRGALCAERGDAIGMFGPVNGISVFVKLNQGLTWVPRSYDNTPLQACALYACFVEYSTAKAHGPASGRLLLPTLTGVHHGDLPTLAQMEVPPPSRLLWAQALEPRPPWR